MKIFSRFLTAGALFGSISLVIGQGNLTPSGAPQPTMKTLQQVEPRTPIGSLPFTITNSCAVDANCASTSYCSASACALKKTTGQTCSGGNQCVSGVCNGGICQ